MTAIQMAYWKAWSRYGQHRFQLAYAGSLFVGLAIGPHVNALLSGRPRDWLTVTLVAFIGGSLMYLCAGRHWRNRVAEYIRHTSLSQPGQR